jgi:hypothetical protein
MKRKAIPVTDRGGLLGIEASRLPYFLDTWLTDGSEVTAMRAYRNFVHVFLGLLYFIFIISRRMVSSGMLHLVALVRTYISEERSASSLW